MNTLGEIVRQYGQAYRARYGEQMLPSHEAALRAIEACRTEALGGQVYRCDACQSSHYTYHSCRNRHCRQCQQEAAQQWLSRQQALLLAVPYFLITFTLPSGLRDVAYRHQRLVYHAFFRASAAALQQLARDERFLDAQIGMLGVLQTWTRDLRYHPHIHYLVPGGGLSEEGQSWLASKAEFFVHVKPLSRLFRAKLRAALRESALYAEIEPEVWEQEWVVDCRSVGSGRTALKYLAPYIYRIALSNNRIVKVEDGFVTFSYRQGETGERRECRLEAVAFLHRYLQHVLPKGFVKVRVLRVVSAGMAAGARAAARAIMADGGSGAAGGTGGRAGAEGRARVALPEVRGAAAAGAGAGAGASAAAKGAAGVKESGKGGGETKVSGGSVHLASRKQTSETYGRTKRATKEW